jgi:hypothetical protein
MDALDVLASSPFLQGDVEEADVLHTGTQNSTNNNVMIEADRFSAYKTSPTR